MSTSAPIRRHRFTVDEYLRMEETGILSPEDRVELIEGEVLELSPIGPPHASVLDRLNRMWVRIAGETAIARSQHPLRLDRHSAPQPDLAVVRFRPDFYASEHPGPMDVLLVVEVADTSVRMDLGTKARLYARADIPEYWVVLLGRGELVVHTAPSRSGYAEIRTLDSGAAISPRAFPEVEIRVADVLGSEV